MLKLLKYIRDLVWGKPPVCWRCEGTRIAYRINDPNCGRVINIPCPVCRDDH